MKYEKGKVTVFDRELDKMLELDSPMMGGGLGVTPRLGMDHKPYPGRWTITHLRSGFDVLPDWVTNRQAGAIMKKLADVTDWTSFDNADSLTEEERRRVSKAINVAYWEVLEDIS
jgi:hypothetical protein